MLLPQQLGCSLPSDASERDNNFESNDIKLVSRDSIKSVLSLINMWSIFYQNLPSQFPNQNSEIWKKPSLPTRIECRVFPWLSRHHRSYQCSGSPLSDTTHTTHSLSSPVRLGGDMIMPHQCVTLSQTRNWFQRSTQRRSVFNNHRLHSLSSVPFCSPWRHSPPGGIGAHQKSRQDCACVFDLSWIRFDES